jgi:hypothetical protein
MEGKEQVPDQVHIAPYLASSLAVAHNGIRPHPNLASAGTAWQTIAGPRRWL